MQQMGEQRNEWVHNEQDKSLFLTPWKIRI